MPCIDELIPILRAQFPSLQRVHPSSGQPVVYLDGPAGSQVPSAVIDAISEYYLHHNANTGGRFPTSIETSDLMAQAHAAAADWFGASDPSECVFGANMTTLTFAFSRALSQTWKPGDRVVVTDLDHDGNVTPWVRAAADSGVKVVRVRVHPEDATLDLDHFRELVVPGTRLVAFTCASNSVGSRTPIRTLVDIAHDAGAEVYLDAVHYAPHDLIDVKNWNADYCVCSAYKFFGPHVGLLWGRHDRLEALTPYKLRPAPQVSPGKWMTGTQNFAAIAGVMAAINYVAAIGGLLEDKKIAENAPRAGDRRRNLAAAFTAMGEYERQLLSKLMNGLQNVPRVTVYGITSVQRFGQRVPTIAMNIAGLKSREVAEKLAAQGIFCWHGDYYAVDICAALGQQPDGMVRMGILHTSTEDEIDRTLTSIATIAGS